jgi:two-component system LytT family sensor kinase
MLRVWAISLAVWTGIAIALGTTEYLTELPMGTVNTLGSFLAMQLSDCLAYVPLTPFAYGLARRHPVERENWSRRVGLLLAGGAVFTLGHVLIRGLTPFASWDSAASRWRTAVDWGAGQVTIHWTVYRHMLVVNALEDLIFNYVPIVSLALAVAYHQSFRQNELRKSQLESHLATARLEALKSQLRPHFLFNTLHSISSLMFTDVAAADQMMTLLSDLLRLSLRNNGSQVTALREELQFVDTYLEIESIRFESRLTIERDIAPDTLSALVPHLLLQPLVENAVRHGVAPLPSGGRIRITANRDGPDHLLLRVIDNGPGLKASGPQSSRRGLGLSTTQERLRALYADDQQMEIRGAGDSGTEVMLRIPLTLGDVPADRDAASNTLALSPSGVT